MANPLDIIPSVVNLVANYENNKHNEQMAQQAHEWDVQSAEQANQWSIEQWNRENAYNTPSAQMSRLAEAGINPALAYSNGTFNQAATSPQVSQTAPAKMAHMMPWQTDPMLMANLEKVKAETEAIKHDTDRKDELHPITMEEMQAEIKKAQAFTNNLDVQSQKILSDMSLDWLHYNIDYDKAQAQIDLWNSQKDLNAELKLKTHEEYAQMVALYSLREENLKLSNKELAAQLRIDEKELEVMQARIDLMEDQGLAANAAALSDLADASLLEFKQGVLSEQKDLYDAQGQYYNDYREHTAKYNTHYHFGGSVSINGNELFNFSRKFKGGENPFDEKGMLKKGYMRQGNTILKNVRGKWVRYGHVASKFLRA